MTSATAAAPAVPVGAPTSDRFLVSLGVDAALQDVGGKAWTLSRLMRLGHVVPPGVVLTRHAFSHWLDSNDLRRTITAEMPAETIRSLVLAAPLPEEIVAAIARVGEVWLDRAPLVVRSSAVGEDAADASFAGQLDSILHVRTHADLRQAVLHCWASYWSARALSYRQARGVSLDGMGVIIQRQIAAAESGVLFTQHPNGDSTTMAVESCEGLADGLVSGRVDPVSHTVPRGATSLVAAPLDELRRVGLRIEEAFGRPQDIEWTRDVDGVLWVVQARPITAFGPAKAASEAGGPTTIWSNANVSENFPAPICPLLYSIASTGYYHYFRNLGLAFGVSRRRLQAMDGPMRALIGVHGARMYYNLTNVHAVLRMAPFGDALARAFNRFVGVDEVAPAPSQATSWHDRRSHVAQALELGRIALATTGQYLFFRRRVERFERTSDAFGARTAPELLRDRSLNALGDDLRAFIDIRTTRWKDASLADAAAMVTYALFERTLQRMGAPAALHTRLLRALPGVPSSQPPLRLWTLSRLIQHDAALRDLFSSRSSAEILATISTDGRFERFCREFQRYLDDWGFRSSSELMLTVPSFQEDPRPVIDLLRQYALTSGEDPTGVMARHASERRRETRSLLRGRSLTSPLSTVWMWGLLHATHRSIAFRERARLKQALLYTRVRRIALAIGERLYATGRLATPDDVFLFTYAELDELCAGRAMFGDLRGLVALRAAEHAALGRLAPPDRLELREGEVWNAQSDRLHTPASQHVPPREAQTADASDPDRCLSGTSACGGRVTASAAVLTDVSDAHRLQRGDILVTKQTDPGWGPVFCLVSGLVIERGGMLSHGAIIAREFGLPCVVGIRNVTKIVQHGDRISVDGDAGTCLLHSARAGEASR